MTRTMTLNEKINLRGHLSRSHLRGRINRRSLRNKLKRVNKRAFEFLRDTGQLPSVPNFTSSVNQFGLSETGIRLLITLPVKRMLDISYRMSGRSLSTLVAAPTILSRRTLGHI